MKPRISFAVVLLAAAVASPSLAAQEPGNPRVSMRAAARFLQQASWGPTPESIMEVRQMGFEVWLAEQFAAPPSAITDPPAGTRNLVPLQKQFFVNAVNGHDQLRQRVAFALSEIWVVSGLKVRLPEAMAPYLRLLAADAFGNYLDLMREMTLNPAMGHYLDMVNNDKPNLQAGKSANENYARELMQLFTVGEVLLNPDGSPKLGADGHPIPTYTEQTVQNFARAFTGWTYPAAPGAVSKIHNPAYWEGSMVAFDSNHDQNPKTLLNNVALPPGQSATEDLRGALENIFNHPNVGPFISKQMIQHLVTSNPSPEYVARVAAVFADNGSGIRGDLTAVVKAILLDSEARAGDDPPPQAHSGTPKNPVATGGPAATRKPGPFVARIAREVVAFTRSTLGLGPERATRAEAVAHPDTNAGHMKEPVLFIAGLLRALGATVDDTNVLAGYSSQMGQNLFYAPSVFSYFSPGYHLPGTNLLAPEFQIYSTSTAILRDNFVNSLLFGGVGQGTHVELTSFAAFAPQDLIDTLDTLFMNGQMPPEMRDSIDTAMSAAGTAKLKAGTALYLVATSALYQVAH